tara:strand:- start:8995 stop:11286 length:2292 start_codon:yes stop_codon:yes gene_type:complete
MLSFDSSLSNALANRNTTSFWVLKLYYNDESEFIGVSDTHRVDGSDIYYGLVSSWGNLQQSLNFYRFTTSASSMTINLINAERSIKGGRFSDLLSSYNFANRKWELFQNTSQAGTYDTAARMIGNGIINGEIKYTTENISFTLLDNSSRYHKLVPYHSVDASTYPNAPSNNYGSPVPMSFGDFGQETDKGDFENHFVKSHFPAIVVNKEDSSGYVNALPDTDQGYVDIGGTTRNDRVKLNQLYANNVYLGIKKQYLQCATSNVIVGNASAGSDDTPGSDGENIIKFKGTSFFGYFDFESVSVAGPVSNTDELIDRNFSTVEEFGCTNGSQSIELRFPKIPKVGMLTASSKVDIIMFTTSATTGSVDDFEIDDPGTNVPLTFNTSADLTQTVAFHSTAFDATQRESLDLTSTDLKLKITDSSGSSAAVIGQVGLQVEFAADQDFTRPVYQRETIYTGSINDPGGYKIVNTEVDTALNAQNLDYIYYAGKGREYGAWVDDSRDNGYDELSLIENGVYIIEDILRNECGLTSSQIDYATFDTSGNSTNGHIVDTFNEDNVNHIKFAFSNYKFINSKELIDGIAKQCCSYVFLSGDGLFKIKTLRRTGDYSSADKTVDFNDINLKSISKTPLSQVKNDITVNYAFDYQAESFTKSVNTSDSTSYGTGVSGNNQTLKLKLDAFGIIDTTTATQLADAYKELFKDQKVVLDFQCMNPKYNDLEIGDIVKFSNWDSNIKIYGAAMGTDYYIVQSISKTPSTSSIKAIKVS